MKKTVYIKSWWCIWDWTSRQRLNTTRYMYSQKPETEGKKLKFENVVFPDSAVFHCKSCGTCCKDQPPDISLKEQQKIETEGFSDFLQNPQDPEDRSLRTKKDGSCIFLTEENICKIQNVKPSICRLEPFMIADFDYNTNTIYLDYNPAATETCMGIGGGEGVDLECFARAAQAIVKEMLELVAQNFGLTVTDERVAQHTRMLLRQ